MKQSAPSIRVVRILFSGKIHGNQSAVVAFVETGDPRQALTEEYLLTKPQITALNIEEILSFKESQLINKWFSRQFPLDGMEMEEDIKSILSQVETLIRAAWEFHRALPVKTTRAQRRSESPQELTVIE